MITLEICKCDPSAGEIREGDPLCVCGTCGGAKAFPTPKTMQPPEPLAPTVWPVGR